MQTLIEALGQDLPRGCNLAAKAAVADARGVPVLLTDATAAPSLAASIDSMRAFFGERWSAGDVAISSDPDRGATHVCQLTAVARIEPAEGWVAVRGNLADLGGWHVGGYSPQAGDRWAEAARFEPAMLMLAGRIRREVADLLALNSRTPRLNRAIAVRLAEAALRLARESDPSQAVEAQGQDERAIEAALRGLSGNATAAAPIRVPADWRSPGEVSVRIGIDRGLTLAITAPGASERPINLGEWATRDIALRAVAAALDLVSLRTGALAAAVRIEIAGTLLAARLPACVGIGRETSGQALYDACVQAMSALTGRRVASRADWLADERAGRLDWACGRLDEESVRRLLAAEQEVAR